MKTRIFGGTGREVPVVGIGTWHIEQAGTSRGAAAVSLALDLGLTHIDTAEMYGDGAAEEIVGRAIEGRRDQVFLVSKVLPHHATRAGVMRACEASLRRLRTDHLDCYLLHWPGSVPLEETLDAFEGLRRTGKVLSWGVSNFDVADLERASAIVDPRLIACNQVLYHPLERAIEHAVLPWCQGHGIAVVAYSPFGSGVFPSTGSPGWRALEGVAARRNATPRQVALAFLLRHSGTFAIPKAVTPEHLAENARAGDLVLDDEDVAAVAAAFPLGPRPSDLPVI